NVGRPPLAETLLIDPVADRRDVVEERVEPDVDRVLLIERDANPPLLAESRDIHIPQLGFHEIEHFIAARLRLNEVRVLLVKLRQTILEPRQREVVARLFAADRRDAVVLADAAGLGDLLFGFERLYRLAV